MRGYGYLEETPESREICTSRLEVTQAGIIGTIKYTSFLYTTIHN